MASSTVQEFPNKRFTQNYSDAELVAKSVKILTAIENCGCDHCLSLLKGALEVDK